MLRLVRADEIPAKQRSTASKSPASDASDAFATCRAYRKVNQLLWRVLQLDEILHHDCAFNPEKAARIKRQLKEKQEQLEQIYAQIGEQRRDRRHARGREERRPRMRLVDS
jgi:hypothetical protein